MPKQPPKPKLEIARTTPMTSDGFRQIRYEHPSYRTWFSWPADSWLKDTIEPLAKDAGYHGWSRFATTELIVPALIARGHVPPESFFEN